MGLSLSAQPYGVPRREVQELEIPLRGGSGKTAAELELERKHRDLEKVVTTLSIQKCQLEQALEIERVKRPIGPARSKRRTARPPRVTPACDPGQCLVLGNGHDRRPVRR